MKGFVIYGSERDKDLTITEPYTKVRLFSSVQCATVHTASLKILTHMRWGFTARYELSIFKTISSRAREIFLKMLAKPVRIVLLNKHDIIGI